jgi:hypothetical protein
MPVPLAVMPLLLRVRLVVVVQLEVALQLEPSSWAPLGWRQLRTYQDVFCYTGKASCGFELCLNVVVDLNCASA